MECAGAVADSALVVRRMMLPAVRPAAWPLVRPALVRSAVRPAVPSAMRPVVCCSDVTDLIRFAGGGASGMPTMCEAPLLIRPVVRLVVRLALVGVG